MIRGYIRNIIFSTLNYDIFRFEDFDVKEDIKDEKHTIYISYSNVIYFNLTCSAADDYCRMEYSPGNVLVKETDKIGMNSLEGYIDGYVHRWLNRVKNEVLNPIQERFVNQKINEFKAQLENKLSEVDDAFFTKEEGEELQKRLDKLEKMISDSKVYNNELMSEVEKMKDEIEFLKATVDKLTKKNWLKNAMLKMWTWSQKPENRKLIEAGVDAVEAISKMDLPNIIE